MIGSACTQMLYAHNTDKQRQAKALDRVAIYEKNTGKQPVQSELLARIVVKSAELGQKNKVQQVLEKALGS
jgi:hypothetical protein